MASQPLHRIPLPWLANPFNPAMSPYSRHLSTLKESVEEKKREGGVGECGQSLLEKPQNVRDSKTQQCELLEDTKCYLVRKSKHAETKLKQAM